MYNVVSSIVNQLSSKQDLYTCTLINKAFHQAANPLLWHTQTINNDDTATRLFASLQSVPYPSQGGRLVRRLSLSIAPWTDDEFLLVMPYLTHLESLTLLISPNITDRSLQQVPHHCPRINDLDIFHKPVGQPTMDALGRHCHQLTRLTLRACDDLGPDTFSSLMPCPLTRLTIENPPAGLATKTIKDLASNGFDQLTHLTLGNSKFDVRNNNEFISSLLSFAATNKRVWPRLTHLTISFYVPKDYERIRGHGVFASGLVRFLQSHGGGLKHLGLVSGQYDDSVLDAMAAIQPPPTNLTSLSLISSKKLTAAAVRRLIQHWPMLSAVSLGCSRNMALNKFPELRNNNNNDSASSYLDVVTDLDEQTIRRIRQGGSQGPSQPNQ
ncbi:unnamed protein product [Absidia cylindrospora]